MTRPVAFSLVSVRRAIEAARRSGLRVMAIRPDGTVLTYDGDGEPPGIAPEPPTTSKWEDVEA